MAIKRRRMRWAENGAGKAYKKYLQGFGEEPAVRRPLGAPDIG